MIRTSPDHDGVAAFSDAGSVEPSVGFDFDAVEISLSGDGADEPEDAAVAPDAREIAVGLIQWLAQGNATPTEIGRRALALQHLVDPSCSQKLLAERLKCSPGRTSSRLKALRKKLRSGTLGIVFRQ